ncbi:MAG: glutamate racemase [Anaerolineae bacterium]|nr:glutamate racemase [Gloeobacterales cyanobacterium ES-bin-313]
MVLGVFDSGVGGLTVLREVQKRHPEQAVIYFADTARLPYGSRSRLEICQFVREIMQWYSRQNVDRVLMACNTSSALALETVAPEFALPLHGLIQSAARSAAQVGQRIGVIATEATAKSRAYTRAIAEWSATAQVWEVGCPAFVPLIESGRILDLETRRVASAYLQPLLHNRIDTLIYGCTHYPHLDPLMDLLLPQTVRRLNPAIAAVEALAPLLMNDLESRNQFFVSGDPVAFAQSAAALLGYVPQVQQVHLPQLVLA